MPAAKREGCQKSDICWHFLFLFWGKGDNENDSNDGDEEEADENYLEVERFLGIMKSMMLFTNLGATGWGSDL